MKIPTVLEISGLQIRRGSTLILDEISWTVRAGEHWVILGANGSGKTSLLSALTGYLMPSRGEMTVLGRTFGRADWRELRCRIGLVSSSIRQLMAESEPALDTVASGKYAMIDYWGRPGKADRKRAASLLRQSGCAHLADRPWAYLSQGERQRVLIARALMARPAVLILDEPCAGLDPVAREHFLDFLSGLAARRSSPTLLFVTHHVEEILPAFTHAMVLAGGRMIEAGAVRAVLKPGVLSQAFGARIAVSRRAGRYALKVAGAKGVF